MRIFLDADILFAACWSNGAVRRLLRELLSRDHTLVVDGYVMAEAHRNLLAKARDGVRELDRLTSKLELAPSVLRVDAKIAAVLPEKDQPVLAAAVHASCDALVTGDRRHFGRLYGRTIARVTIYDPASLAEALLF
jgi:predicted nucleic acid-binding protein